MLEFFLHAASLRVEAVFLFLSSVRDSPVHSGLRTPASGPVTQAVLMDFAPLPPTLCFSAFLPDISSEPGTADLLVVC